MQGELLAQEYPAFTGVPVNFQVVNDSKIYFDLPDYTESAEVDLIVSNPGGILPRSILLSMAKEYS